jgi:hypothetical protein
MNQRALIDDREPVPPTRLAHQRRQRQLMQKNMLKTGEDNFKLISECQRGRTRSATETFPLKSEVDWVKVIIQQPLHLSPPPRRPFLLGKTPLAPLRPEEPLRPREEKVRGQVEEPEEGEEEEARELEEPPDTTLGKAGMEGRLDDVMREQVPDL